MGQKEVKSFTKLAQSKFYSRRMLRIQQKICSNRLKY